MTIADNVKHSKEKLAVQKNYQPLELATLKLPNEREPSCRFLLTSDDDNALLFVDSANNSLKKVNLENKFVEVIYRCDSPDILQLQAAIFVEFAPKQKALLVAEMLSDSAHNLMSHSLSVAHFDANTNKWTC